MAVHDSEYKNVRYGQLVSSFNERFFFLVRMTFHQSHQWSWIFKSASEGEKSSICSYLRDESFECLFLFSLQFLPKDSWIVAGWHASRRLQQEIVGSHFILLQKATGLYIWTWGRHRRLLRSLLKKDLPAQLWEVWFAGILPLLDFSGPTPAS